MSEDRLPLLNAKKECMFTRIQSIADKSSDLSNEIVKETFLCELELVDKLRSDFERVLDEINSIQLQLKPSHIINYQPLIAFDDLLGRIKRAAKSLHSAKPEVKCNSKNKPKLARIELPEFSGDIKSWPLFYSTFKTMVHNNPELDDSDKLHYLTCKLKGKAQAIFTGISPCAENYTIILEALIKRYEDKRLLANSYLDQIFDFKPFHVATVNNLEQFLDKFATAISAIKNLKIDNLSEFLFLYLALKKIDKDTAQAFELENRGSGIPTFDAFVTFIRDQLKILQNTSGKQDIKKNSDRRVDAASKPLKSTHTFVNIASVNSQSKCSLCDSHHDHLYKCSSFHKLSPSERFKFVKLNSLCINCLSTQHRLINCKSKMQCRQCQMRHHTMLHFDKSDTASKVSTVGLPLAGTEPLRAGTSVGAASAQSPSTPAALAFRTDDVALCALSPHNNDVIPQTVLLATARVIVVDSCGTEHYVRALLDSASQSNFISNACCDLLGLICRKDQRCAVKGIGGTAKSTQGSVNIKFYSRLNKNISFEMESLVVDTVTELLPTVSVNTSLLTNFKNLPLADDTYAIPGEISLLIGASIFPHLLLSHKVQGQPSCVAPHAIETVLGYVIVGSAPTTVKNAYSTVSYCCAVDPLDSAVRKFWELEEVVVPPILSPDDRDCEDIYAHTTTREDDGRYTVALPFKGDVFSLGNSRRLAEKCFLCLERKMQTSPKLKQAYDDVISEYLEKGYIEIAPPETNNSIAAPSYIIPHHGVVREDKLTSKLRVVLNGSAKTSTSVSLNDILHSGPNLQGNLFNIIINFRIFAIALSADIRQMFLCINVRECDRKFQRILYRFSPDDPLQVYQFNRVCFGLTSSPYHALRTIKQLVADDGDAFPKARETIETGLYMDDFVYCVDSEDEAISTAVQVISLMKAGQFDLVKWTSNSQTVLNAIPPTHRLSSVKEFDDYDTHKVLGLCWSPSSDLFSLKICTPDERCTKRNILSCVARLWDLMGFVAPVILYAKLLIRELWLINCDWDELPPDNIVKLWQHYREELPTLEQLKIPRHVDIKSTSVVNIIAFADASEKAYGGVVYFHVQNDHVNSVHLISAKSKVAPRKVVSLARLELCAALVLAKLVSIIIDACSKRHKINNVYAFSDSTVALCWIHSSPHRWDTFVANRVSKIQSLISPQNFYHIPGIDNPADCLSRGLTPAQIINHPLWFRGPSWTSLCPEEWPISAFEPSLVSELPEERKHVLVASVPRVESPIIELATRFSSWSKLLRCTVYVCRFAKLLPSRDNISAADLDLAENLILKELQKLYFAGEIANILTERNCSRAFQRLKPFIHNGLIRVGGRLTRSRLTFDQKHPIVLPRKHHILNLLVDFHHKINCHAGPDLLMSLLRQKYWILSARNLIRNRVHNCLPCYRLRPKHITPEMAEHRPCRVNEAVKPFVHTGTDYAGPFKVTLTRARGIRATKAYVCLFVCLTTRAVHIELAGDLSTACFLSAFKRFLSRRGPISRIYSDNGTNFIGARRIITEHQQFLRSKHFKTEFGHTLSENRIDWSLNVPAASHFGGNWEANIKSLKTHLYRVIGEQVLSFEEMSTVLTQIEAVMNTRPLCRTLSSDPCEPLALTPAHFLNYTPLKYLPAREVKENRLSLLSRHDLLDKLVQSFWRRWRSEYLHTLQTREKWNTPSNPIRVGTVVILKIENAPPLHWPLGLVEEVFPATNGVTRVVRVKTASGSYLRPVVRLCPLPNQ